MTKSTVVMMMTPSTETMLLKNYLETTKYLVAQGWTPFMVDKVMTLFTEEMIMTHCMGRPEKISFMVMEELIQSMLASVGIQSSVETAAI